MKLIRLHDLSGAALIFPAETGFHYTNQVGGGACEHPVLEGILIPLNNDYPLSKPEEFIENKLCSYFSDHGWGKLTIEEVDKLDAILGGYAKQKQDRHSSKRTLTRPFSMKLKLSCF